MMKLTLSALATITVISVIPAASAKDKSPKQALEAKLQELFNCKPQRLGSKTVSSVCLIKASGLYGYPTPNRFNNVWYNGELESNLARNNPEISSGSKPIQLPPDTQIFVDWVKCTLNDVQFAMKSQEPVGGSIQEFLVIFKFPKDKLDLNTISDQDAEKLISFIQTVLGKSDSQKQGGLF